MFVLFTPTDMSVKTPLTGHIMRCRKEHGQIRLKKVWGRWQVIQTRKAMPFTLNNKTAGCNSFLRGNHAHLQCINVPELPEKKRKGCACGVRDKGTRESKYEKKRRGDPTPD